MRSFVAVKFRYVDYWNVSWLFSDCSHDDDDASQVGNAKRATAAGSRPTTDDVIGHRKKKSRTVFSRRQVVELETTFAMSRYLSSADRCRLAARLQLSETQVKIWFQNRRNKWKRQSAMASATTTGAHSLGPRTTPADEDLPLNVGASTPRETREATLMWTDDKYSRHSLGDATHPQCPLSPATLYSGFPPLIHSVLPLPHYVNGCGHRIL